MDSAEPRRSYLDSEKWTRIQTIFDQAVDEPPTGRAEFIRTHFGNEEALAGVVLRMLEADASGTCLLDEEVNATVTGLFADGTSRIPPQMFGPYRLVQLLGEGGMGIVYLAEREDLGSKAAIKILRDSALSPLRRQQFAIEQQVLARLNHPSIARFYDADTTEDGTPFIVMEYVEGLPLGVYVGHHQVSIEDLLALVRSICESVQYAHAQAVIHRDLKPSNILVTRNGGVKLLDFGISKHLQTQNDRRRTATGLRLLTPAYSAPEQLRNEPTGIQADVYSLGVILYEILSQRLPYDFSNQTPGQIERTIEQEDPKPPSYFGKQIKAAYSGVADAAWRDLDTLCLKAMHKDRTQRYQSVEALMRDLDHYLKGEPLEACPASFRYITTKFVGRNRRVLTWLSVTTLLLVGGAAYSGVRITKAKREAAIEAERTQQVQRFMLSLFDGGDADAGPSGDLRVTTLLDRGVRQAQMLDQDPETAAQLSQTLAGIYAQLGKADRADPLLQSALEKRKNLYGPNSPKTAETMTALGLLRLEQAKPNEAERLTRAALAIDKRLLPANSPSTAKATYAVGRVLDERGHYSEALPLLQQAVQIQRGHPELAADLAESTSALADANYYTGSYPVAQALNHQALAIHEKLYGPLHPRVADDLINLGEIQHDLGHDVGAEKLYRHALQIKTSWYGERHPDTAFCMMAVGQSLIYQKRFEEASPFIQRSLEIQQDVYGKFHPRVAMALNTAGVLEQRRGHYDAAEHDFIRMAGINRSVYGDRHYLVGISILNLGQVYFDEKRYPLAEQSFNNALDRFVEKLPAGHPSISIAQQKLGNVLVMEHKYKEAQAPLVAAIEGFNKQTPQPAERLASARRDLTVVYQRLHERDSGSESTGSSSSQSNRR